MKYTVADVMTNTVVSAQATTGFKEILRRMSDYRVSALPVLDDDDKLLGVVSEADLLLKEELGPTGGSSHLFEGARQRDERHKAAGKTASELMSSPAVTARPRMSIAETARVMHQHGVKRLPVVDENGRVVGIVSRVDLLRVFRRADDELRQEVEVDLLDRALWLQPSDIVVEVKDGVVTLSGTAERRSLIPIITRLVERIEGVVAVRSGHLNFDFDDTALVPAGATPWGIAPRG